MISDASPPAAVAAEADPPKPARLWNRNYLLLWQGQFVSGLGNNVFDVALALWVVQVTNSASLMGLLLALSSIPQLLFAPIGGVLADRYSRKKILVGSDLLSGLLVLSLALLVLFFPQQQALAIGWVFVVSLGLSTVSAFFGPAAQATIPDLVPAGRIATALSLGQLSGQIAHFVGAGLGGLAFRLLGAPLLFLLNAVSFFVSSTSSSFITAPRSTRAHPVDAGWRAQLSAFRNDLVEGLQFVWRSQGLRALVIITAVGNFFSTPFLSLMQFYLRDYLRLTNYQDWVGYLGAAVSVGALLGFVVSGVAGLSGRPRALAILGVMLLDPFLYGLLIVVPGPWAALGLVALAGATGAFLTVNITTLVQLITPQAMRGRVFGLLGTIAGSITPIAYGVSGVAADLTGKNIALIYALCAAVLLMLSLTIIFNRNIRGFLAYEPEEPAAIAPGQ